MNDDSAEYLRTQIKNLWFSVNILSQSLPEIILVGITDYDIRQVMVTDSVYQPVFRICDIRTCFLLSKALIAASSARMNLLPGKSKYRTVLFITRLDQCANAITVSVCFRAEGYNHNSHIYSHQEVVLCNDIQIAR